MDTSSIITGTTLNRYQLDIPSCTASLDVEEFSGEENSVKRISGQFISPARIKISTPASY